MAEHPAELLERVENLGVRLDHHEQRERLLKVGFGANVDKEAEYMIQAGCHAPFAIAPVKSLIDLMHHFGVSYTLLSRLQRHGEPV